MSAVSGHVFRYVPRPQDAALVGRAFESSSPAALDFETSGQGRLL